MVPRAHNRVAMARRGVPVWGLPAGPANPPPGSDWRESEVLPHKEEEFGCYVRKIMALQHIGVCGVCGTRRGHQRAVWSLGIRVCRPCWIDNVISHRTLLQVIARVSRLARVARNRPSHPTGPTGP